MTFKTRQERSLLRSHLERLGDNSLTQVSEKMFFFSLYSVGSETALCTTTRCWTDAKLLLSMRILPSFSAKCYLHITSEHMVLVVNAHRFDTILGLLLVILRLPFAQDVTNKLTKKEELYNPVKPTKIRKI